MGEQSGHTISSYAQWFSLFNDITGYSASWVAVAAGGGFVFAFFLLLILGSKDLLKRRNILCHLFVKTYIIIFPVFFILFAASLTLLLTAKLRIDQDIKKYAANTAETVLPRLHEYMILIGRGVGKDNEIAVEGVVVNIMVYFKYRPRSQEPEEIAKVYALKWINTYFIRKLVHTATTSIAAYSNIQKNEKPGSNDKTSFYTVDSLSRLKLTPVMEDTIAEQLEHTGRKIVQRYFIQAVEILLLALVVFAVFFGTEILFYSWRKQRRLEQQLFNEL